MNDFLKTCTADFNDGSVVLLHKLNSHTMMFDKSSWDFPPLGQHADIFFTSG